MKSCLFLDMFAIKKAICAMQSAVETCVMAIPGVQLLSPDWPFLQEFVDIKIFFYQTVLSVLYVVFFKYIYLYIFFSTK